MALGIYLLILGLLIVGFGAWAWQFYNPCSIGIAAMVTGGGLAVGGIIRMVVKR